MPMITEERETKDTDVAELQCDEQSSRKEDSLSQNEKPAIEKGTTPRGKIS